MKTIEGAMKEVTDSPDKLLDVQLEFRHDFNTPTSLDKGDIRDVLGPIFDVKSNYLFVTTSANPAAAEELLKYVGIRKNMSSPWQLRRKTPTDRPAYVAGAHDACNGLAFDASLIDVYLGYVITTATKKLGKNNYASYPLIGTRGVHSLERLASSIYWPTMHVLRDGSEDMFTHLIEHLNDARTFTALKQREVPQHYQTGELTVLYESGVSPLLIGKRKLRLHGQDLKNAIDFLVPFMINSEWRGPVSYED